MFFISRNYPVCDSGLQMKMPGARPGIPFLVSIGRN
jgi:hypothetical protein